MAGTPELIEALAAGAGPVRRLRPPLWRATAWLALEVALTGVLAAVAACLLSLPDRSRGWALLLALAAALWLAAVGVGCLTDWVRIDDDNFQWGAAASCFGMLVLASVPLSAAMFWMLRHAAALRPTPAILCGGLAVAALSACALSLLHIFEASAMILLWHFGTVALVMGVVAAVGRRVLQ